jgi:hypothetical protein
VARKKLLQWGITSLCVRLHLCMCVRLVNFELHFANTFSNVKMTNITNVDPDELIKLGNHDFFS